MNQKIDRMAKARFVGVFDPHSVTNNSRLNEISHEFLQNKYEIVYELSPFFATRIYFIFQDKILPNTLPVTTIVFL